MMLTLVLVLCFQISVHSAPMQMQMQLLHPFQNILQTQVSLQQQMAALQQLQALQRFNTMQTPVMTDPLRPLLILLPTQDSNTLTTKAKINDRFDNLNENEQKQPKHEEADEESDSITIDADDTVKIQPKRAILLVPSNGRFSIGEFISSIPFLPIEINVPDTISWIYNGISGIIGGIGQRLPFRPQNPTGQSQEDNMRINLGGIQNNQNGFPYFMMPYGVPMLPMQF